MEFWKEHVKLRMVIMAAFVILGIICVVSGWKMTGELKGLGIMILGVVFLLATLFIYNKPFTTPSGRG